MRDQNAEIKSRPGHPATPAFVNCTHIQLKRWKENATRLASQSGYRESLIGNVSGFNLECIGRAPAQPLRVGLTSSPSFVASLGSPAHFNLLDGGIHVPIKNILGLCSGSGHVSTYIRGQNQSGVQPAMEQSVGSAYRTGNAFRQCNLLFRRSRWDLGEVLERACNRL